MPPVLVRCLPIRESNLWTTRRTPVLHAYTRTRCMYTRHPHTYFDRFCARWFYSLTCVNNSCVHADQQNNSGDARHFRAFYVIRALVIRWSDTIHTARGYLDRTKRMTKRWEQVCPAISHLPSSLPSYLHFQLQALATGTPRWMISILFFELLGV